MNHVDRIERHEFRRDGDPEDDRLVVLGDSSIPALQRYAESMGATLEVSITVEGRRYVLVEVAPER